MSEDVRLTVKQVAERMGGVDRSTVWRIPREQLPYELTAGGDKRPGHRRYLPADVDAYLGRHAPPTLEERVSDLEQWRQSVEERLAGRDQ